MDSKEFLATPEKHHHVSRLMVLVLILVVLIAVSWVYNILFNQTDKFTVSVPADPNAAKQSLLSASSHNPPANLTPQEIKIKQAQLKLINPSANLSPQEIEAKRNALKNI